ncbi:TPA: N-acetyltransferase family protein [Escherichia coli]
MSIRFARKADCAAIAEIYNHAVLYTAAIWNDQTVDADNRIAWFEARTIAGYPVLVSEEDGVVTGYASFGDWRRFGRWLDLTFMQLQLDERTEPDAIG